MIAIPAILAAAVPTLIPMAIKLGAGLLPERAAQVVSKGLDIVKAGIGPVETAIAAIKHVAGITGTAMQRGADISVDDMNQRLQAMGAAVDEANAHAEQLRQTSGQQGD